MATIVEHVRALASSLIELPAYFESTYDEEADVLYLSFEPEVAADDSELTDDGLLLRYKDGRLIGVTVMNASHKGASA
jgi:uncharacterized protein YuzE